jgi:hypothetical protein
MQHEKQAAESAPATSGGARLQQDKMAAGEDPATIGGAGLQQEEMASGEDPATCGAATRHGELEQTAGGTPTTSGGAGLQGRSWTVASAMAEFERELEAICGGGGVSPGEEKQSERGNEPPVAIPLDRGTGPSERDQEKTYRASSQPNGRGEQGTKDELELWVEDPRTASRDEGRYRASSPPNGRGEQGTKNEQTELTTTSVDVVNYEGRLTPPSGDDGKYDWSQTIATALAEFDEEKTYRASLPPCGSDEQCTKNEQTGTAAANYGERLLLPSGDDGKHNQEKIGCESTESEIGSDDSASSSDENLEPEVSPRDHWTCEALDIPPDQRDLMYVTIETGDIYEQTSELEDHWDTEDELNLEQQGYRLADACLALALEMEADACQSTFGLRSMHADAGGIAFHALSMPEYREEHQLAIAQMREALRLCQLHRALRELRTWRSDLIDMTNEDKLDKHDRTVQELYELYELAVTTRFDDTTCAQLQSNYERRIMAIAEARQLYPPECEDWITADMTRRSLPCDLFEQVLPETAAPPEEMTAATPLKQTTMTTAATPLQYEQATEPNSPVFTPDKLENPQNSPVSTPEKYAVHLRPHDGCGKMTNTPATGMGNMLASAGKADSGRPSGRPPDS